MFCFVFADFFYEKMAVFQGFGQGTKFEKIDFRGQKIYFPKTFKLTGNDYHRIWNDLGVLFHLQICFRPTLAGFERLSFDINLTVIISWKFTVFEKSIF